RQVRVRSAVPSADRTRNCRRRVDAGRLPGPRPPLPTARSGPQERGRVQAPTASARHSRLVTRRPGPPSPPHLDPTPVPPVLLTRDYPRAYALSLLRSGVLRPVRKGALIGSEHLAGLDTYAARRTLALARIAAVSRQLHAPVMTHSSAAALWGLP